MFSLCNNKPKYSMLKYLRAGTQKQVHFCTKNWLTKVCSPPVRWLVQPGLRQPCRSEAAGSENWNHRFGFYAFSALGWRTKFGSIKWARKWVHFCTPILSLNKEIETWVQIWVRNMDPNLGHRTRTKNRQHCKQRAPTTLQNFPARSPGTGPREGNEGW